MPAFQHHLFLVLRANLGDQVFCGLIGHDVIMLGDRVLADYSCADQPGGYESGRVDVNVTPARHYAYAVQWFLMAAALVLVFLLGGTNLRAWLRGEKTDG